MSSELKKLQKEIKLLRMQNQQLQNSKNMNYTPNNIIHNNSYVYNTKTTTHTNKKKQIPMTNPKSNYYSNKNPPKPKKLPYAQKKTNSFVKLPFKRGLFSFKNSLNISNHNNINVNKDIIKHSHNNSLLSANLILNLDNEENENINKNNISQQMIFHHRISSSTSLDLNKYKITELNMNSIKKSINDFKMSESFNQGNNFINNNYNSVNKKGYNLNNSMNNNKDLINQSSMENLKISQKQSHKDPNSSSIIMMEENIMPFNNEKKTIPFDNFKNNSKYEKESRRLIVEYIKILIKNPKNLNLDTKNIMSINNISKKVLNKRILTEFNTMKTSVNTSLINSAILYNSNNIRQTKNFISPIKSNINNFLTEMNDEKIDKIKMVNFLSVPRILVLYFQNKTFKFVCFLCPNNISYINGIESYIFKFVDLKTKKVMGGFDLIKIKICSLNINNPQKFYIETYDGKVFRKYEFDTGNKDISSYYVKSINYMVQLEKCKIFKKKNISE